MIKLTDTIQNLPHSPTLWANDLVHQKRSDGETVYHMGFGESPFPVPARLEKALADAAHRKEYLKADGLDDLCEAVREYYRPIYGDDYINATEIIIAPGSKLILYALQMAIEGDLLMPVPSWVSYDPQAKMLHADVIKVPTTLDDDGYHIDPEELRNVIKQARENGQNPSKIILNAPSNPTGLTIPSDELEPIAKVCEEEGVLIISDEIYGLVSFDGEYRSCAPYAPAVTAVTTGLSKHLSLGGWRIGVGFIPKDIEGLHNALRCIVSETWSCVSSPIQQACVEAYKGHKDIEDHIQACTDIHALMNKTIAHGLREVGIIAPEPQGAFYNYPNFEPFREGLAANGITTSQDVHEVLLKEYNLATLPGKAFGAEADVLTLRLSGCDYDGATALKAYQDGETLDRAFIEKYAPRVLKAIEIFGQFVAEYGSAEVKKVGT
ncbi:MAG: aminotransferase class I/II-fold pyridoxal phosphate-dependent enzyme [Alphaproteobacteria bacterium]|nr:aminotransferase class I/II-fold pyridoxal phosphate-dependent enzyme [Alphaproteobacteria bacterium]